MKTTKPLLLAVKPLNQGGSATLLYEPFKLYRNPLLRFFKTGYGNRFHLKVKDSQGGEFCTCYEARVDGFRAFHQLA